MKQESKENNQEEIMKEYMILLQFKPTYEKKNTYITPYIWYGGAISHPSQLL